MADDAKPAVAAELPRKIIYKWKKHKHEHHGGAWKVAFADFMTAMFALFLVLWILTQSQDVKTAVASYFRHATDYEGKPDDIMRGNQGLMENKQGRLDTRNNVLGTEDVEEGKKLDPQSLSGGLAKVTAEAAMRPQVVERVEDQEKDEVRTFLKIADELWQRLGMDPSFAKTKDNMSIEAHEEGLLVQIIQQPNAPLFDENTGQFKPALKQTIAVLGKSVAKMSNKVEIDGHGSIIAKLSEPGQVWQASLQMADLMRAELEKNGVRPVQITKVAGCGYTRLLNPNNINDPTNQRISILIRPRQWTAERY